MFTFYFVQALGRVLKQVWKFRSQLHKVHKTNLYYSLATVLSFREKMSSRGSQGMALANANEIIENSLAPCRPKVRRIKT